MGELLFGLLMTLTFTLGAGVLFGGGPDATEGLLIAAIGCNVAWGVIDAALYLISEVFDRSRLQRLGHSIAGTSDDAEALALVAGEFDPLLGGVASAAHRTELYRDVVTRVRTGPIPRRGLNAADARAAIAIFVSVFLASVPAALPFLLIDDAWLALRVSNAFLIGMLFFVGYRWARYTSINPWLFASGLTLLGVVLVLMAIPLGG
jgi:VIT1/CCC1 family predicted Fe2+/Mn2+ transporter